MASRDEIVAFLDQHLEAPGQADFCPNGVQVEGAAEVTKVVTGVTACMELFEAARDRGAQMVLVHHGMFWSGWEPRVKGWMKARIRFLIDHDISLVGYHLPLDRHAEDGNNAQVADRLHLRARRGFAPYKGVPVGMVGELPEPVSAEAFGKTVGEIFGREPLAFPYGPPAISTVAVLTGKGDHDIEGAHLAGADAYITGEAGVSTREHAREAGIHFYAAGHHATERWGVQALGDRLAGKFGLAHEYVDITNPV